MKLISKFLVGISLCIFIANANAEVAPDVLVKQTADEVLTIIKNDKEIQAGNKQQLYALVEAKILPNFDFDRVCRMVLGKSWRSATPEQQAIFQKEFRSLYYGLMLPRLENTKIRSLNISLYAWKLMQKTPV